MSKKLNGFITILLAIATLLFAFPKTVFADGGEGTIEKEVNGYHIVLTFVEPVKAGENQFHIQITDAMGMPVTNADVKVSAMPTEGMEMATEAPAVGVMTSNSGGMDMATEAPATGVMKPNKPAADEHSEDVLTIMLEPTVESGEYAGNLSIATSGEWMFNVHFTVNGETTEVDFPIDIARTLGLNYATLAGFLGINATAIATAAVLKRKPVVVRK
jgi:hypothetical protein